MELPHFYVLNGNASTQSHPYAITRAHERVGGGGINPTSTAGCDDCRLGTDVDDLAGFHAKGNHADNYTILIFDHVYREPFVQERGVGLYIGLIERVQQCVARTVSGSTCSRRLTTLTKIL